MANKSDHKSGHRGRLRDRYLKSGINSLAEYEIVEMLLALGTPRRDVKPIAKELIKKFKSLRGVLDANDTSLKEVKGVGPNNIFGLRFVHDVASEYLKQRASELPLANSPGKVFDYLYHSMAGLDKEVFKMLSLDAKNKIIRVDDLFEGTVDGSVVYLRETVKQALSHKAVSVIFAHNHLSGDPKPSKADKDITQDLVAACMLIEITVLDHIVIGDHTFFSFADEGLIDSYRADFDNMIKSR